MKINKKFDKFLDDFVKWASAQPDIQAIALVGSYARNEADETSDLDLVLITDKTNNYIEKKDWTKQFGMITKQNVENYGILTSIKTYYSNDCEVEYGITDQRWSAVPLDIGTKRVISDGMKILFERGNILSRHLK